MTSYHRGPEAIENPVRTRDGSLSRAAELKNRYYALLYTEMAERKQAEESLRLSNQLLTALSRAQLQFVAGAELGAIFHDLLVVLLATTESSHGLIRTRAGASDAGPGSTTSWSVADPAAAVPIATEQLETVAEQVLATPCAVFVTPQPAPPSQSMPSEPLSLVGLPIACGESADLLGGVLVLARPGGTYHAGVAALLQPLITTCAQLLIAQRNEEQRRAAEAALYEERALLAQRVEQRTAELRLSNAELARAARAKDEFLATMNHELRTPLNAVLLYAESLLVQAAGPLNSRQLRAATGIRESANHLLMLINDILDVARIEAGRLNLEIAPISVESACQSSLRLITEQAYKKSLKVNYERDPDLTVMDADERRLKQMLVNLLGNAVKFTPEGGAIGLEVRGDQALNIVRFAVWDTGIGIAPEDLPKLFQPFVQLDNGHTRQHGGTGLGLVLVYRMVEMHLGSIAVESKPGEGSRFTITLPWQRESYAGHGYALPVSSRHTSGVTGDDPNATTHTGNEPHRAPLLVPPGEPRRGQGPLVLLAEDNEDNIDALSVFILQHGCRLIVARTGREAVRAAKTHHPSLILMDVQMPETDGLEATRIIRADPELGRIPIIALTALAMPGDRERCLEAGASDYLTKPIQPGRLMEMIHREMNCCPNPRAQSKAASSEIVDKLQGLP